MNRARGASILSDRNKSKLSLISVVQRKMRGQLILWLLLGVDS